MSLRQRTALVSGGSRGIGKGIALGLAQAGARVAISYRSNKAAAQNTLREMQAKGQVTSDPRLLEVLHERARKDSSTYIRLQSAALIQDLGPREKF